MAPNEHAEVVRTAMEKLMEDFSSDSQIIKTILAAKEGAAEYDGTEGLEVMTFALVDMLGRCFKAQSVEDRRRFSAGLKARTLAWCDTLCAATENI